MVYIRDDFKKLRWNVIDLREGDVIKFPEYNGWEIPNVNEALLVKWIVYMYDINSPMAKIDNLKKRAVQAANESGFPLTSKGFTAPYKKVMLFDSAIRIRLFGYIIEYCKLQKGADYAQLAVYEHAIANNNEKIIDPETEPTDLKNILNSQETLSKSIKELRSQFFSGAGTIEMDTELSIMMDEERLEYSPEKMAMNKDIRAAVDSYSPYGRWKYSLFTEKDLTPKEYSQLQKLLANDTPEADFHFKSLKNVNKNKARK